MPHRLHPLGLAAATFAAGGATALGWLAERWSEGLALHDAIMVGALACGAAGGLLLLLAARRVVLWVASRLDLWVESLRQHNSAMTSVLIQLTDRVNMLEATARHQEESLKILAAVVSARPCLMEQGRSVLPVIPPSRPEAGSGGP